MELPFDKTRMWKEKTHLPKFDKPSLRVICFPQGPAFRLPAHRNEQTRNRQIQPAADVVVRPAIKHVPRSAVPDAHERIGNQR
jgi:hypothetical protein